VSTVTRTWMAFAALGAGFIHWALVITSPVPVAVVLLAVGAAEVGWGILTLVRERIAKPRLALFAALVPTLLWGLVVAAAAVSATPSVASYLGFSSLGAATLFELFIGIVLAVQLRRGADLTAATRTPPAGRYLLGLVVGGVVVGAILAPALAATDAGSYAQPMGGMNMGQMGSGAPGQLP
jgi:hypothetical protein